LKRTEQCAFCNKQDDFLLEVLRHSCSTWSFLNNYHAIYTERFKRMFLGLNNIDLPKKYLHPVVKDYEENCEIGFKE